MTSDQAKTYVPRDQGRVLDNVVGKARKFNQTISFLLNSQDDKSMSEALRKVENLSLSRNRLCVVSILAKEPINSNTRDELVQFLSTTHKTDGNKQSNTRSTPSQQATVVGTKHDDEFSGHGSYLFETQVAGHIDFNSNIVFLNIKSFMDSTETIALIKLIERNSDNAELKHFCLLEDNWPGLCHNVLKTFLLAFIISHVIICYVPTSQIDYNLIRLLKNLNALRLRASSRLSDLLASIATSRGFPAQWIRQARVCCPRLLIVQDLSHIEANVDLIKDIRQQMEDQVYSLFKSANLVSRSVKDSLFELSEQGDFLFLLTNKDFDLPQTGNMSSTKLDIVCQDILRLLDLSNDSDHREHLGISSDISSRRKIHNITINETAMIRFKKFIQQHISVIQTNSQSNKVHGSAHSNLLLPRCDDFMFALGKLRNFLFPLDNDPCLTKQDTSQAQTRLIRWRVPDLRQFVDIYDLNNVDEIFSRHYCYKATQAALDMFKKLIVSNNHNFDEALQVASDSYLKYARGSARGTELNRLNFLCHKYWSLQQQSSDNQCNRRRKNQECGPTDMVDLIRTTKLCVNSAFASSSRVPLSHQTKDIVIVRHSDGVKLETSCDCGRKTNLLITPVNRSKRLERINVRHADE